VTTAALPRAPLLAPLVPLVLKTDDNLGGIDETMFETLRTTWRQDFTPGLRTAPPAT
jgi:hypothetical protein